MYIYIMQIQAEARTTGVLMMMKRMHSAKKKTATMTTIVPMTVATLGLPVLRSDARSELQQNGDRALARCTVPVVRSRVSPFASRIAFVQQS